MEISEVLKLDDVLIIILGVKEIRYPKEVCDLCELRLVNRQFRRLIDKHVMPFVESIPRGFFRITKEDLVRDKFPGIRHITPYQSFSDLGYFTSLTQLHIISGKRVGSLKCLTNLTWLAIENGTQVKDSDISGLTQLQTIILSDCNRITSQSLSLLTNLSSLDLSNMPHITDDCFRPLCVGLKSLSLNRVPLCNTILEKMTSLTSLRLFYGTEPNIQIISKLTGLKELVLGTGFIQNCSFHTLTNLEHLRIGRASNRACRDSIRSLTQISSLALDDHIEEDYLSEMKQLTTLSLRCQCIPPNARHITMLTTFHFHPCYNEHLREGDLEAVLSKLSFLTDLSITLSRHESANTMYDLCHMTQLKRLHFGGYARINLDTLPPLSSLTYLMCNQDLSDYLSEKKPPKLENLCTRFKEKPCIELFRPLISLQKVTIEMDFLDDALKTYFYRHYIEYSLITWQQ